MECVGNVPDIMTLQRYVDFAKFVSLLDSKKLFMARASTFEDQLEGNLTPIDTILGNGVAERLSMAVCSLPSAKNLTPEEMKQKEEDNRLRQQKFEARKHNTVFGEIPADEITYEKLVQQQTEWVDVSCWHANEKESMAMWKIYGGTTNAVCIVTDVRRLKSSVSSSGSDQVLVLAEVQYISHQDEQYKIYHPLAPLMHKAHFYNFEQEIRLLSFNPNSSVKEVRPSNEYGSHVAVDLSKLIKEIRVASKAPSWFHELVENVVKKYELNVPVIGSDMNQAPIF